MPNKLLADNDLKKVLLPLGLGTAFSLLGDAILYTILPTHGPGIGIALGSVGILLSINRVVRLFLNGPAGWIYDRMPRRLLFVSATFLGAISTAFYAIEGGFGLFLIGRMLWGLSWSFIWVGGTRIVLDVANDKNRGHWMGLYQISFFLGASMGAFVGGILTDLIGYTATMWTSSLLTGFGGLIALIFLPETRPACQVGPDKVELRRQTKLNFKTGLTSAVSINGVNRFVTGGVIMATLGLLVQEQMESHRLALGLASITGALMAVRNIVSMVASTAAGKASDWLGSRWKVALWSLVLGAAGMGLLSWNSPAALVTGIVLASIAGGGLQTISSTLPGDLIEPGQQGTAIGLIHTSGDLGSAIGPPIAYAMLPWTGLQGIYLLCGGLFLTQIAPVILHLFAEKPVQLRLNKEPGSE